MLSAGVTFKNIVVDEGDRINVNWGALVVDIADKNEMAGGVRLRDVAEEPADGFKALSDIVPKGSQQKKASLDFLRRLSQALTLIDENPPSAVSEPFKAETQQSAKRRVSKKES